MCVVCGCNRCYVLYFWAMYWSYIDWPYMAQGGASGLWEHLVLIFSYARCAWTAGGRASGVQTPAAAAAPAAPALAPLPVLAPVRPRQPQPAAASPRGAAGPPCAAPSARSQRHASSARPGNPCSVTATPLGSQHPTYVLSELTSPIQLTAATPYKSLPPPHTNRCHRHRTTSSTAVSTN